MRPERRGSIGTPASIAVSVAPERRCVRRAARKGTLAAAAPPAIFAAKRRGVCRASELVRGDMRAGASGIRRPGDGRTAVLAPLRGETGTGLRDPCFFGGSGGSGRAKAPPLRAARTWRPPGLSRGGRHMRITCPCPAGRSWSEPTAGGARCGYDRTAGPDGSATCGRISAAGGAGHGGRARCSCVVICRGAAVGGVAFRPGFLKTACSPT